MSEIIIPPLGESITEATIASIQKKVGDFVEVDELLIELETDKVTLEVNAQVSGVISELTVSEGDTVRVAQVIGAINPQESSVKSQPEVKKAEPVLTPSSEKIVAPSAQRIITENKLELSKIEGSGRDGRVMKEDALQAAHKSTPITPSSKVSDREEIAAPMTRLRQTIAKRLKDSQNTAAILTTFNEIDMSALMDLRKEYQDIFVKKYGIKVGFMSFFVRAACVILNEIPAINAEIRGNDIIYKNYCDIGVAVGTDKGLVVPIIRDAQNMGFAEVEQSIYNFGMKAKKGEIGMSDLQGGTFTISNGGTYGSLLSTPIINPPQSGILGMHNIVERPVAVKGQVVIRPMMYVALSYDHRIIDGKEAVTFLVRLKQLIEDPRRLILDI